MKYNGRQVIKSNVDEITRENIKSVLTDAISLHTENSKDIQYLYSYYTGIQPILMREKTINRHINNKIVENRAYEIVNFKVSYLCGEPIQYTARKSDKSESVMELNEMLSVEFKQANDKNIVFWQMICGTAYRMTLPDKREEADETPFEMYVIDPTDSFIIYKNDYTQKQLAGVYITQDQDKNNIYNVYTNTKFYKVDYLFNVVDERDNTLGLIPIVEYPANETRMGAFEPVLYLLDAKNNIESNRVDGIEQFIQSIIVALNCDFEEGVTADEIKKAGMIVLKTIGDNKPDFKILSEQLNQEQTQILCDYVDFMIDKIVGMPSTGDGKTSDSSNNGAVILKNGWQGAEARAKDTEIMFKKSEQQTLKILLRILHSFGMLLDLSIFDIDYKFTRRCYEDINSKANVLNLLLNNEKVDPKDAYNVSGLFPDNETAYQNGLKWYEGQLKLEEKENVDKE